MLVTPEGKPVTRMPHRKFFDACRKRLTDDQYGRIIDELVVRVSTGGEVHTSSWIPGADWNGTPFQAIYEDACGRNVELAAQFFGLALWDAMMQHDETWSFGRYKLGNIDIKGLTYFRVHLP